MSVSWFLLLQDKKIKEIAIIKVIKLQNKISGEKKLTKCYDRPKVKVNTENVEIHTSS